MSGMYGNITVQVPYESVEGKTLYVNNDTNISGSTASGDNVNADYNVRWIYPGGIISKGWLTVNRHGIEYEPNNTDTVDDINNTLYEKVSFVIWDAPDGSFDNFKDDFEGCYTHS